MKSLERVPAKSKPIVMFRFPVKFDGKRATRESGGRAETLVTDTRMCDALYESTDREDSVLVGSV